MGNFEFFYEPFYISLDSAPAFDERFIGYGFTRNTQVSLGKLLMHAQSPVKIRQKAKSFYTDKNEFDTSIKRYTMTKTEQGKIEFLTFGRQSMPG